MIFNNTFGEKDGLKVVTWVVTCLIGKLMIRTFDVHERN